MKKWSDLQTDKNKKQKPNVKATDKQGKELQNLQTDTLITER